MSGNAHGAVYVKACPAGDAAATEAAVQALLEALPAAARLGAATHVLVKPNLLARHAPEKAVTTHPDVLRAVILALRARGVSRITVADSPGGPYGPAAIRAVYRGCGIAAVCEATGAEAYDACESAPTPAAGRLVQSFTLLRPALECDVIVNLPKLKTHVLMTMSGAVKNLFGLVPGLQKAEFHMRFPEREDFAAMLVDLCETVQPQITLVDGLLAMEGDGPAGGTPRPAGLLFAGQDPYAVDLALCRAMGMDPAATPVLAEAHRRGLCPTALDDALLLGDEAAKAPLVRFAPPRSYSGRVDFSSSVPGFLQPLVPVLSRLAAPRPVVHRRACVGCGKCAEICPQGVITVTGGAGGAAGKAKIDRKGCIRCFCCHEMCPVKAIGVRRMPIFKM